jgi:hypothetical protein
MELELAFPKMKRTTNLLAIKEVRTTTCEFCGEPAYGEPHHIRTRGAGGPDIKENLIQLCGRCHVEAQEHKIKPHELIQIVAQRENTTPEQVYRAIGWPVPDQQPAPESKPAEPSIEDLIQAYITLEEQEADCRWAKAQLLDAMVSAGAKASWIASQIGTSAAQVREMVKVYRAFPQEDMRIPELSWYHHRLAANTPDPGYWIARAADEQMSTRQMREAIIQEDIKNGKEPPPDDGLDAKYMKKAEKAIKLVEEVLQYGSQPAKYLTENLKAII